MQVLHWMGEHALLTIILFGFLTETITRIFIAGKIKAMKCPKCGYSKVNVDIED